MNSFSGPSDIHAALVEGASCSDDWLLALLAFALIEDQKIEWMTHHAGNHGAWPSDEEIRKWYQQQPQSVLARAHSNALARLADYSRKSIDEFLMDFEKETEQGVIVREIKSLNRFWPQLGMNVIGGLAGSLLFTALLTLMAFMVLNDSSPVNIAAKLRVHKEEISNVQDR